MINKLLLLTLIISVLLFGSVEIWSAALVCFMVFTLGLAWVLMREYNKYEIRGSVKLIIFATIVFILYGSFQTVPLPASVLKMISPVSFELHSFYSLNNNSSMPVSFNTYQTVAETLRWTAFLTVFAISAITFTDRRNLVPALKTLSIFGFSLAIFAIVQKATWHKGIYWHWELTLGGLPFGPFVNRNHFAGLIDMLIPLGLGLALTEQARDKKILFGFITVIMAVSLFFSLSRGGILSFFAGMLVFSLLILCGDNQSKKVRIIGSFVTVVLCYVVYLGIGPIINRFYETDITGEERLAVWSATWNAVKDFLYTGSGLGSFINIFPLYSPPIRGGIYDHAHNDYLEFFLEAGLPGVLFMLTFISLMLYMLQSNRLNGRNRVLRAAAASGTFTMLVHSIFDFNLHILSNMLVFAYLLGITAGLSGIKDNTEENNRLKRVQNRPSDFLQSCLKLSRAGKEKRDPFFEGLGLNEDGKASTGPRSKAGDKAGVQKDNRR